MKTREVVVYLNCDEELTAAADGEPILSVEPDGEPWFEASGLLAVPMRIVQ